MEETRALAAGQIPIMSELLHVLYVRYERGPIVSGNSTTTNCRVERIYHSAKTLCQKWIGTSHMVSHTRQNSKPDFG